jgi:DEAD/DEAH box helicase domain-containing protein
MRKIVFDIETKNLFSDIGANNPALLDIAVVCIHDSETDQYSSYIESELPNLWPILETTDMLIGYNSDHFDIPLLNKYFPGDLTRIKSVDIMKAIKNALGRRLKLDGVARATLGKSKTADGLQAISWWKKGEIDKIREYCIEDVRITKELYDHALRLGKISYRDLGVVKELVINTKGWDAPLSNASTHALPF